MTFPTESVSEAGSGLVFVNYYDPSVTSAYRTAILTAEHQLQSDFTSPVTISVDFTMGNIGAQDAAENEFSALAVSYSQYESALRAHALTANQLLAVNGLPVADPSNGKGIEVPLSYATMLGLTPQTNDVDLTVTLNNTLNWTFGQDAVSAIEHEVTEGGFGRISSLGIAETQWAPLDLFRFTAGGQRDYTGGQDGAPTYFGLDSNHVSSMQFHNSVSTQGVFDGQDLGDWDSVGDAFGPGGPGSPGTLSSTDLQVLSTLGWSSSSFTPAADDYANSLIDTSHPFGQLTVGGAISAALQQAGDRDWFQMTLQQGDTYTISLVGSTGGGGTLADPLLRLHDAAGNTLVVNDDITNGANPDSRIVFSAPTSGVYYAEAGAFADGYTGSYTVELSQTGTAAPGATAGESVSGQAGDDTIVGSPGYSYLRGNGGDDQITGGAGFNDINGNQGDDTIVGHSQVGDWLLGGQGNDSITAAGSTAHNLIYGNLGNDTLIASSGGDTIRGGQGDDSIVGGSGADWISGDKGHDTIAGGSGAETFHSGPGMGVSLIENWHAGDHVQLDAGSTYTVTQSGANVLIDLGGGAQIILQNTQLSALQSGWLFEA